MPIKLSKTTLRVLSTGEASAVAGGTLLPTLWCPSTTGHGTVPVTLLD
jgi:hypothetical protein